MSWMQLCRSGNTWELSLIKLKYKCFIIFMEHFFVTIDKLFRRIICKS